MEGQDCPCLVTIHEKISYLTSEDYSIPPWPWKFSLPYMTPSLIFIPLMTLPSIASHISLSFPCTHVRKCKNGRNYPWAHLTPSTRLVGPISSPVFPPASLALPVSFTLSLVPYRNRRSGTSQRAAPWMAKRRATMQRPWALGPVA